jgi:hypothetical protein
MGPSRQALQPNSSRRRWSRLRRRLGNLAAGCYIDGPFQSPAGGHGVQLVLAEEGRTGLLEVSAVAYLAQKVSEDPGTAAADSTSSSLS